MKRGIKFARNRTLLVTLLIFLVVLAAAVLLLGENLSSMFQALYRANYYFIPLAVLVYLTGLLIWSVRWRVTLSSVGQGLSIRNIYVVILGGIFINNITPFTYAGGDPIARAFILKKKYSVPYTCGFATILAEYVVDLPVYVSFLVFGFLLSVVQGSLWLYAFMISIWAVFMLGWGFFFRRVLSSSTGTKRIAKFASRLAKVFHRKLSVPKVESNLRRFYSSSEQIVRNRRVIAYVVMCTVTIWSFAMLRLFIIFQALGYMPSLQMLFFAITLPALAGMIPALPGGLLTVDFAITSVLLLSGAPFQIALSVTLIERAITLVFSTLLGAGAISYLGLRSGNAKRPSAKRPL